MKMRTLFAACAASLVVTLGFAGCSGDDNEGTGDDGGTADDATSGGDSSTSGGDTGTGGDTGSSTDTGPRADTGTPGDGGDAGNKTALCNTYCTCMEAVNQCATKFDAGTCRSTCAAQTTWDLNCRTTHCGYAQMATKPSEKTTHCGHAAGESMCQ